jgi:hypothetical protein
VSVESFQLQQQHFFPGAVYDFDCKAIPLPSI